MNIGKYCLSTTVAIALFWVSHVAALDLPTFDRVIGSKTATIRLTGSCAQGASFTPTASGGTFCIPRDLTGEYCRITALWIKRQPTTKTHVRLQLNALERCLGPSNCIYRELRAWRQPIGQPSRFVLPTSKKFVRFNVRFNNKLEALFAFPSTDPRMTNSNRALCPKL